MANLKISSMLSSLIFDLLLKRFFYLTDYPLRSPAKLLGNHHLSPSFLRNVEPVIGCIEKGFYHIGNPRFLQGLRDPVALKPAFNYPSFHPSFHLLTPASLYNEKGITQRR